VIAARGVGAAVVLAAVGAVTLPLGRDDVVATAAARPGGDPGVEVSADGEHWGDRLAEPLFDPRTVWVPGEVRTRSFWVRARRGDPASLVVSVVSDPADEVPPVRLAVRSGRGGWATSDDPRRLELVGDEVVTPGSPQRVDVRASVLDAADPRSEPVPVVLDVALLTTAPRRVEDQTDRATRVRALVAATGGALLAALGTLVGRRRSRRVRAVLALGLLLGASPVGTLASWQSARTVDAGSFVTGTLDLRLRDATTTVGAGGSFAHVDLAPTGLLPGESVAASFPVRNDGSTAFTWQATATATGSLAPGLTFSTYVGGTATNTVSLLDVRTGSCGGTASTSGQTLNATAKTVVATQPSLAAAGTRQVCVLMSLPATATAYAGTTAAVSYSFVAQA